MWWGPFLVMIGYFAKSSIAGWVFMILGVAISVKEFFEFILKETALELQESPSEKFRYHKKWDFFDTTSEIALFHSLGKQLGDKYHVFAQVNLDKIIFAGRRWHTNPSYNKIAKKSVDFLLLDKVTLRPTLAIELDGGVHNRPWVKERDIFKDEVFKDAGIPLYRIKVGTDFESEVKKIASSLSPQSSMVPMK